MQVYVCALCLIGVCVYIYVCVRVIVYVCACAERARYEGYGERKYKDKEIGSDIEERGDQMHEGG